jgi:hypothetical protein
MVRIVAIASNSGRFERYFHPNIARSGLSFMKSVRVAARFNLDAVQGHRRALLDLQTVKCRHVLHDWSDENCVRILRNIRATIAAADTETAGMIAV